MTVKAIGMLSGGLDSSCALGLMLQQEVKVKALNFYTGFCTTEVQRRVGGRKDGTIPRNEALRRAAISEVEIEIVDIAEEYMSMVTAPRHGYGAHVNPCIDCRIFMLTRARQIMEREGASFVFTGEVLGQRPMSQRREAMRTIERESGLEGRILRPLSARLLPPTIPEREGLIDRARLMAIRGRSRKAQMALAAELGIGDYPQPAGGCCNLTDESYARKFRDLFAHRPIRRIEPEEAVLLAAGRHLRLGPRAKLIVGRTEGENAMLTRFAAGRIRVEAVEVKGPVALLEGQPSEEERLLAARIVARYGKGKDAPEVAISVQPHGADPTTLRVEPLRDDAAIDALRI